MFGCFFGSLRGYIACMYIPKELVRVCVWECMYGCGSGIGAVVQSGGLGFESWRGRMYGFGGLYLLGCGIGCIFGVGDAWVVVFLGWGCIWERWGGGERMK
jgi:hypothetical protein